jgi:hypothetical protein
MTSNRKLLAGVVLSFLLAVTVVGMDHHREDGLVGTFDDVAGPADDNIAAAKLLHHGRDPGFIFFHRYGIFDFANIDQIVGGHERIIATKNLDWSGGLRRAGHRGRS